MGWKDKVKAARLPETTEDVVMRGDLLAEYDDLREKIEKYKAAHPNSLAGIGIAPEKERLQEIEEEMRASVVKVTLRAVPRAKRPGDDRPTWRELNESHPPRIDEDGAMNPADRLAGAVDVRTFPEALVRACIVKLDEEEKPFPTDDDWSNFSGALTQGQFDRLLSYCQSLNRGAVSVPFSSAGFEKTGTSGDE